jgi:DNA replication protein DnaC
VNENSTYQLLRSHLSALRLATAAEALPGVLEEARVEKLGHTAMLERLLGLEVEATEQRRRASLERFASLPAPWRLSDFDFDAQPSVDRSLVNELGTLRFLAWIHRGAGVVGRSWPEVEGQFHRLWRHCRSSDVRTC